MSTTESGSRVQRKRGRRRQEIVAVAAELFGERGYDAVSLDDVAERKGGPQALAIARSRFLRVTADERAVGEEVVREMRRPHIAAGPVESYVQRGKRFRAELRRLS